MPSGVCLCCLSVLILNSEIFSHGIHVAAKDLIHSRRANREVFVDIGWIPYTVCTGNSCNPGMIAHSAFTHFPILSFLVDYTRSIPRFAGTYLSTTEIKTSQRWDLIIGFKVITSLSSARQVSSDVRNYHIHRVLSMNPRTLIHYLYPRLVALHDLDTEIALPQMVESPEGTVVEKVRMPSYMRNSYHFMEANGVYLLGMFFLCFPLLRIS